jgi:RHS repeat-associated protein
MGRVRGSWTWGALAAVLSTLAFASSAWAQVDSTPITPAGAVPSVRIMKGVLVAPNPGYYGSSTTSTNGLCRDYPSISQVCISQRPPEVKELARALRNSPDLIYEYVRNSVDTEFQFGLQKGALGVITDASGTSFDQASLMVELLRESGYTAGFVYGTLTLDSTSFYNWTGISDATQACLFLATGGIPAAINSSSPSDCSGLGSSITSVVVQHVWVQATIGGTTYYFDPSYKVFTHKAGIRSTLISAAGLNPGAVMSAAASGSASGSASGVNYVSNFSQSGVTSTVQGYASNLLSRLKQTDMQGADMTDVVGGRIIVPLPTRPAGGWRQTSLNQTGPTLTYTAATTWPSTPSANVTGVPDQFRTTLQMAATVLGASGTDFNGTFFVDEIYSRRLMIASNRTAGQTAPYQYFPTYLLDGATLFSSSYCCSNSGIIETVVLTANHPFAANSGGYGDSSATRQIDTLYPVSVVHGWGRTSEGLGAKWQREYAVDTAAFRTYIQHGTDSPPTYTAAPSGDLQRSVLGATWLAQFSRAGDIHAELVNARMQHLHSLGVAYNAINRYDPEVPHGGVPPNGFIASDQMGVFDVETAFGLTARDANSVGLRRRALHAIAATAAALEGSVYEQATDTPDAASTARRFAWGNAPEAGETPDTTSRRVYDFTPSNASAASGLIVAENSANGYTSAPFGNDQLALSSTAVTNLKTQLNGAITNYAAQNFEVIASSEAMLGPGYRNGTVWSKPSPGGGYMFFVTNPTQVGGALIANLYDGSGDPTQIAHVVISGGGPSKGGGGAATDQTQFNLATLQNSLKDRFVDRSTKIGVDLASGIASFSSPVLESVGQGDFPYRLERKVELKGTGLRVQPPGDTSDSDIDQDGLVSNWQGSADPSNSADEAMGKSRVEASAPTIAAFLAMQDIWSASPQLQRELSGELVADWWGRQLIQNVVTISQGSNTEEFVRLFDGSFLPAKGGGDTVQVSGTRNAVRLYNYSPPVIGASSTRQWHMNGLSYTWTGLHKDTRQYVYWEGQLTAANLDAAGQDGSYGPPTTWDTAHAQPLRNSGFRLSSWSFPYGVTLTLAYGSQSFNMDAGAGIPVSVSSSLGRTLSIPALTFLPPNGAQTLSVANLASETTKVVFLAPQAGSGTARPVASGEISSIYEPINQSQPAIQYAYDTLGRVMQAQDAVSVQQGTSVRKAYSWFIAPGYRGEWDDPNDGAYAVETMQDGRFSRVTDEVGNVTTAVLDGRHRVTTRTFPEQDQEQFTYDANDQMLSLTRVPKPGSPLGNIGVSATYDPVWNNIASFTDAYTKTTTLTYYGSGAGASKLYQVLRPAVGGSTPTYTYQYNSIGLLTSEADPSGVTTGHGYDSYGNLTSTTSGAAAVGGNPALNLSTNYTPDSVGNTQAVTDPRGNATTYQFDPMRRKTDELGRNGGATATPISLGHWVIDANGRITTEQHALTLDASGNATSWASVITSYTPTNKKAQVTDASGYVTQFSYDKADRLYCQAVRMNPAVYSSLPDACTLSTPSSPTTPDRITQFLYDAAGQKLSETRALGIVSPTYPVTLQEAYATYAYNGNGTVAKIWDANNNLTTNTYDGFDRLAQVNFPSTTRYATQGAAQSSSTDIESYTYDLNSNRLTLTKRDRVNQIDWCYDVLNRETGKYIRTTSTTVNCTASPTASGVDVLTSYDLAGRKLSALYSSGQGVSYAFDAGGRMKSEATNGRTVGYAYDNSSNLSQVTWPDTTFYVNYTYDALNRLSQVQEQGATSGAGLLANYTTYDPLSRPTAVSFGNGAAIARTFNADDLTVLAHTLPVSGYSVTFGPSSTPIAYNPAHQILSRPTNNTAYDFGGYQAGASWTSTANGLNQDATIAAITGGGYDANGNEINDGTRQFTYDTENRLITASIPSASTNVTLSYDPTGRLQQDQATISGTTTTTQFLYAGDKLIAEYVSGAISARYVHGSGEDQPLVWYPGSGTGTRTWLHADNQGSVIATSTNTTSAVAYTYGAYGEPNSWSGSRFRYTGQIMLSELKLYYYKARVYDPIAGRFMQTDPLGYEDDLNLYEYVGDDPTDKTDPTGTLGTIELNKAARKRKLPSDDTIRSKFKYRPVPASTGINPRNPATHQGDGHFGPRNGGARMHWGTDFRANVGDAIVAPGDGTVVSNPPNPSHTFGRHVEIDHGDRVYSSSNHMSTVLVRPGQVVVAGQQIGTVGRTGNLPPLAHAHDHFEVRIGSPQSALQGGHPVDPMKYLPQN